MTKNHRLLGGRIQERKWYRLVNRQDGASTFERRAEKAKKDLSGVTSTQISLPFITAGEAGPLHLEMTLTRAKFDDLTRDLVERTKLQFVKPFQMQV